ncbi:MAG: response regulator transcription factor [Candidatus Aminicenantes bacterium]|nr:response regulator transcription factor [Candidatus Aminicenantes bacterium]
MKIKALIVDDEDLARDRLRRLLREFESLQVVGEARDGSEALRLIRKMKPDVLFLDIKMPGLSGFEMIDRLDVSPHIIFTTAYDAYALKAFEANTVDYLLKPIKKEDLERAVGKLGEVFQQAPRLSTDIKFLLQSLCEKDKIIRRFSVKRGDKIWIVPDGEILYFHAEDKVTFLNTAEKSAIISFTLKELESRLDPEKFMRANRSFIVNLEHIDVLHRWFGGRLLIKMKGGKEITASRACSEGLKKHLNI